MTLNLFQLVLQIAVILVAARLVGFLFQKINQPQVMGEMVAGILLGPSLLGWLAPGYQADLVLANDRLEILESWIAGKAS